MKEPEVIFVLNNYLSRDNCPVVVKGGLIERDGESEELSLEITLINVGELEVKSTSLDLHITDRGNHEITVIRDYKLSDLSAKRNDTFSGRMKLDTEEGTAASFAVSIRKVVFEDESEWEGSATWMYDSLPKAFTPEEYFENKNLDPELGAQFARSLNEELKSDIKVKNIPLKGNSLWLCSCGRLNRIDETECTSCGLKFEEQQKLFEDTEKLSEKLTAFRKSEEERLERERIEKERLEREEKERIEREKKEAERRAKRNHMLKIGGLIACVLVIVGSVVGFTYYNRVIVPHKMLVNAQTAFENKDYKKAAELYTTLGADKYEDEINESNYQYACALFDEGKYSEGASIFEFLGDYKDSEDKITYADYQSAISLYDNGKWDDAISAFQKLDGYEDSVNYIQKARTGKALEAIEDNDIDTLKKIKVKINDEDCLSQIEAAACKKGISLYEDGKYDDAKTYFAMVTSEKQLAKINAAKLSRAETLIDEGDYDTAEEILDELKDYEGTDKQMSKLHYLRACTLLENGEIDEAEAELEKAGDYEGSSDKLNEILYARAQKLEKDGETEAAVSVYESISGYKDADTKAQSLKYSLAKSYYDSENYEKASALFEELGDYEDSHAYYTRAQYRWGSKLFSDGKYVDSYNALYKIKWYEPAYYDLVTKSAYYQYVYDVGVGPNPNDEKIDIISDSKL